VSTDCYAVVFQSGDTGIYPANFFAVMCNFGKWFMYHADKGIMCAISQVWHCPSPVDASRLLMNFKDGDIHPSDIPHDCVLICRNPAPKEKP